MITILLACPIAFMAGFVDSIAGGGGLIQVPGLLFLFPNLSIVTLLGSNKLAASCGTVIASFHYVRAFRLDYKQLLATLIITFICSIIGAKILTVINNETLKPIIYVLLILIGIYTLVKKNFGIHSIKRVTGWKLQACCIAIGAAAGLYDGFFGPGTGSILLFLLVGIIGFSFLEGSAFAKLINLAANIAATLFFIFTHHVWYALGVPMAVCNVLGNSVGARLAIKKGSGFVRWMFLAVILLMVGKFFWHIIFHYT